MFTRIFRLLDRLSRLFIKITARLGGHLTLSYTQLSMVVRGRLVGGSLDTDATRVEAQVQSLSGLTVILLASVVALVFWATSSSGGSNPVAQLLYDVNPSATLIGAATPQPTPVAEVSQLHATGTIVFSMVTGTQEDLFALASGPAGLVRLTNDPADDRDPVWSPDGQRVAFSSRRDGNWELYILEIQTGEVRRLTDNLVYEANPSWSPDGVWLAYEGYYSGNLNIYFVKVDGSEGPVPLTGSPTPEFDPEWLPLLPGRYIAYVSWKDGNQDIYVMSLDDPDEPVNLTHTRDLHEQNPAWSPDGTHIAYSVVENGSSLIYTKPVATPEAEPVLVGQGHSPAWSPDGNSLIFLRDRNLESTGQSLLLTGDLGSWDASVLSFPLPALASDPDWTAAPLPAVMQGTLAFAFTDPLPGPFVEPIAAGGNQNTPYRMITLSNMVDTEQPYLSDRVDGAFMALRDQVNREVGWDFLSRLDNVFWNLNRPPEPGQNAQSWHKAGRAFDIVERYNLGNPPMMELVPEQIGPNLYWRLFVRANLQDGTQGEPLRSLPWDFMARFSGDMAAYEAGGRLKETVPPGYYVDFTRLAQMYGWVRTPSDMSWRYLWPGILYWQYQKTDSLDWWTAMLEIFPQRELEQFFLTPTPTSIATSTPAPQATGTQRSAIPAVTTTPAARSTDREAMPSPTIPPRTTSAIND